MVNTSSATIDEVDTWLCWAGKNLMALSVGRIKPQEYRSFWPDVVQDLNKFERLNHGLGSLRATSPSKDDIPIMDTILTWPNRCEKVLIRRVLHARSLVNPITDRHVYGWTRLGKLLQSDRKTIKRWHETGLEETADKLNDREIWLIREYFA